MFSCSSSICVKLACSERVESWLLSFMRHGVVAGVDEAEAGWSPWPSCVAAAVGPVARAGGPAVVGEASPSLPVPSIWWKFHKPTLRMQ